MAETLILPAPSERLLIAELAGRLPGVDVRGFRTGAPPGRQIQVRKTGGWEQDPRHERAQLTVTCWGVGADDEQGASDLASEAVGWVRRCEAAGSVAGWPCQAVQVLASPYPSPDPATGRARYVFTAVLTLHTELREID